MPCIPVPGGFACTRGVRLSKPCEEPGCNENHVALCDWPLTRIEHRRDCRGKYWIKGQPVVACNCPRVGTGKTCSRRMCKLHRHMVGTNRDYCGPHHRLHLDASPMLPGVE